MAGNQSFEAPEAEKAEPNPESDSGSDSDSAESGSEDGEGLSDSEGVGAAELGEPRESETLAVASSITESGSQLLSGTVGSLARVGVFGWVSCGVGDFYGWSGRFGAQFYFAVACLGWIQGSSSIFSFIFELFMDAFSFWK